jgi:hypothetical protein
VATARNLLLAAHCSLGKVSKPRARKHHKLGKLMIGSTKPGAGAELSVGAKISVKLVGKTVTHKRAHR